MPNLLPEGMVLGIDHVGVCVADIDRAGSLWSDLLATPVVGREDLREQKTAAAFLRFGANNSHQHDQAAVELVCPLPGNRGLEKFTATRGDALHHLAFAVRDLTAALEALRRGGVELIDQAPRPGAGGHLVAFLHPRAMGGTLVELVERVAKEEP